MHPRVTLVIISIAGVHMLAAVFSVHLGHIRRVVLCHAPLAPLPCQQILSSLGGQMQAVHGSVTLASMVTLLSIQVRAPPALPATSVVMWVNTAPSAPTVLRQALSVSPAQTSPPIQHTRGFLVLMIGPAIALTLAMLGILKQPRGIAARSVIMDITIPIARRLERICVWGVLILVSIVGHCMGG